MASKILNALSAAMAVALSWTALGAAAQPVPSVPKYPSHDATFAGGVTGRPDVTYSTVVGYRPLTLDLYLPSTPGPHPLVVYVHGGGWERGEKRLAGTFVSWPDTLASIAARGYVVASVSYRLSGEARFPAALTDVKTALAFLRSHAQTYGIDPSRAVIWGASAGGQLATLVGATCGVAAFAPRTPAEASAASVPANAECVQGVIDWYGVADFGIQNAHAPAATAPATSSTTGRYFGCEPGACPAGLMDSAGPIPYLSAKSPPFLIIHGAMDRQVPVEESKSLKAALDAKGVAADLLIIPDVDHSFVAPTPERGRDVNIMVMQRVNQFLDKVLPVSAARGSGQ